MPRSGWLALGAVAAALADASITGVRGVVALALFGAGALAAAGTLALALRGTRPRAAGGARSAALVAAGAMVIGLRLILMPLPGPPVPDGALPVGSGPWTGEVTSISAPKNGTQPVIVALAPPLGFSVAATLPVFPVVVPGDLVTMTGSMRPPPVDDPYGDYLLRIGAAGTLRADSVTLEPPTDDLGRQLEGLRRTADAALRTALPEPEAGLASGILIGLRDRVDRDLTTAFTAVGATHVVAISGWNIAIVASTLAALAGRVARRRRVLLTAIAIVAYVAFVGPSPSVLRAAGMAAVVMAARELGRPSRAAAAIGWAVTGLVILSPPMVGDPGFQLSALATVGLISWGTPLTGRLAGPAPGRVRSWLAESLGVSLAAQLATLPIVVLSFGRLSIVSPVVNLGVVPLIAPAMGAGALALGGGLLGQAGLPGFVATVLGLPAWVLFGAVVGLVRAGASIPFASVQLEAPWDAVVAAAAGLAILGTARWLRRPARHATHPAPGSATARPAATRARGSGSAMTAWWRGRAGRVLATALATSVLALAVVVIHRPDGVPRVTVLDVGQGDAILVEGDRGGRLLIDGGPDPGRLLIALEEHLPPWDRRIDLVILSHPHEDHAAGLAALLARYAVRRVLEPGMIGPGPGYAALNAELIARGIGRGTLATGDRLAVDDIHFDVLWPDRGSVPERPADGGTAINNVSIVLLGEVDGHRFLLAGDIEEGIDPILLARGLPQLDFLKVAHHGSRTSSTAPFLAATRPGIAVISAGRGNPYGHPAPATVERLTAAGAHVFRTDDDGSVTVDLGPGPVEARASGGRNAAATAPRTASAFLCGLPPPPGGVFEHVATTVGQDAANIVGAARLAPVRPFGPTLAAATAAMNALGYAVPRDDPIDRRPDAPASLERDQRAGRLLLGRRRVRAGRRRGNLPSGRDAVSGRAARALARSGRVRRERPPPR